MARIVNNITQTTFMLYTTESAALRGTLLAGNRTFFHQQIFHKLMQMLHNIIKECSVQWSNDTEDHLNLWSFCARYISKSLHLTMDDSLILQDGAYCIRKT